MDYGFVAGVPVQPGALIYYGCGGVVEFLDNSLMPDHYRGRVVIPRRNYTEDMSDRVVWERTKDSIVRVEQPPKQTSEETSMLQTGVKVIKDYAAKHRDTLVTIGILLLVDHYFFEGKMRTKIRDTLEAMFNKLLRTLE